MLNKVIIASIAIVASITSLTACATPTNNFSHKLLDALTKPVYVAPPAPHYVAPAPHYVAPPAPHYVAPAPHYKRPAPHRRQRRH